MHLNPFPAVKTFTWTAAERHTWRSRYWLPCSQKVYRRNRRKGAGLSQHTLKGSAYLPLFTFKERNSRLFCPIFLKFTFDNFISPVRLAILKFYLPGLNFTSLGHRACTIFRRLRVGDLKSGNLFIKGFYHIKGTACFWMCTSCYMCIKTQTSYEKVI